MSEFLTNDFLPYSPHPPAATLTQWFEESSQITQHIFTNLHAGDELVPQLHILNPPLWEFGHLTWFHEFWVHRGGQVSNPPFMVDADYLFNSSEIAHQDRWSTPMPSLDSLLEYNLNVMSSTQELLCKPIDNKAAYFIQLSIFHQDMHNEAFAYMWQTLGRPMPFVPRSHKSFPNEKKQTWIHFLESSLEAGSHQGSGFIFDNEKWAHTVNVPSFDISSSPVTNADYLTYLESANNLHQLEPAAPPKHWRTENGLWFERFFDEWLPLNPSSAVRHIDYFDAQRYCKANGLRLPNEHELTILMSQKSTAWQPSHLWEWTSSPFVPFPGFSPDPYTDYSLPWFNGKYQVLKGGSLYTPDRLKRPAFRNFYQPNRSDHFCGFRTCLL